MGAPIPNRSSGKLVHWFPDLSGGVNTTDGPHAIPDNQMVEGINFAIEETGSISKRLGYTRIAASLGAGKIQSLYLYNKGVTRTLLAVYNGLLYKHNTTDPYTYLGTGNWVEVPIRRHAPQVVTATNATSGAVGANIAPSTNYDFQVAARDAAGVTKASTVTRVTSGATAFPINVAWDKVLGAINYDVYVNNKLVAGSVGDVGAWTWSGNETPNAAITPPAADTTKLTITIDSEFVTWNDRCYFTSGNGICTYDGITASLVVPYIPTPTETSNVGPNAFRNTASSLHKCRLLRAHKERLFLGGDPDNGRAFYFSYLGMAPAGGAYLWYPGTYGSNVTTENGEPITGIVRFREALVLFTRSSIFSLLGSQPSPLEAEPFELRATNTVVGALSHRGIAIVDNAVIFVSLRGIYALVNVFASDKDKNVTYLSRDVEKTFYKITRPEQAVCTFNNHQYIVCFPSDGLVLRCYVDRKAWVVDTKPMVNTYVKVDRDLYAGDTASGLVYKFDKKRIEDPAHPGVMIEVDTYSDDGQAIDFNILTKSYSINMPIHEKKTKEIFVAAKQQNTRSTALLTAHMDYALEEFILDFNESTVLGTWELGKHHLGWVDMVLQMRRWKERGHHMFFRFQNKILDEPVTIYGFGVLFKIKKA